MKKITIIILFLGLISCHKADDANLANVSIIIYKAVPQIIAKDLLGGFYVLASNDQSPSSRSLIHFNGDGVKTAEAKLPPQTQTLQYQGMAVTSTNECLLLYSVATKDSLQIFMQRNIPESGSSFNIKQILLQTLGTGSYEWLAKNITVNFNDEVFISSYKKIKATSEVKIQLSKFGLGGNLMATATHHLNVYSQPLSQLPAMAATPLSNGTIVLATKGDDINYSGFIFSADNGCQEIWRLYSHDKGITGIYDLQEDANSGNLMILAKTGSIVDENKDDFYLIALDNNGNEIWNKAIIAADGNIPKALEQTGAGGFVITGSQVKYDVAGNLVLDRSILFVVFTDQQGQSPRMLTYGSNPGSEGLGISEPSPGNFMLLASKASFGNYLNPDMMLIKIDENGELR